MTGVPVDFILNRIISRIDTRAANRSARGLRRYQAEQARIQNELARDVFNRQMGVSNTSDSRLYDYERTGRTREDSILRTGFDRDLTNQIGGFDTQLALADRALNEGIDADRAGTTEQIGLRTRGDTDLRGIASTALRGGYDRQLDGTRQLGAIEDTRFSETMGRENSLQDLLTSVREGSLALTAEERERQRGFQDIADQLASTFVGSSGRTAFDADAGAARGEMDLAIAANATGENTAVPGVGSADGRVTRERTRLGDEARATASAEAGDASQVASYDEGIRRQNRRQIQFGEDISLLDDRAGRSASTLIPALQALAVRGDVARANTEGRNDLTNSSASARSNILSDALAAIDAARQQEDEERYGAASGFYEGSEDVLATRLGRESEARGNYFSGVSGTEADRNSRLADLFAQDTSLRAGVSNDYYGRLIDGEGASAGSQNDALAQFLAANNALYETRVNSAVGSVPKAHQLTGTLAGVSQFAGMIGAPAQRPTAAAEGRTPGSARLAADKRFTAAKPTARTFKGKAKADYARAKSAAKTFAKRQTYGG